MWKGKECFFCIAILLVACVKFAGILRTVRLSRVRKKNNASFCN